MNPKCGKCNKEYRFIEKEKLWVKDCNECPAFYAIIEHDDGKKTTFYLR